MSDARKRLEKYLADGAMRSGPGYSFKDDLRALLDETAPSEDENKLSCERCPFGVTRRIWSGWCKKFHHAIWRTEVLCSHRGSGRPLHPTDPEYVYDDSHTKDIIKAGEHDE